jgi:hypothetical protein
MHLKLIKEALRGNPNRTSLKQKLIQISGGEIHPKRKTKYDAVTC